MKNTVYSRAVDEVIAEMVKASDEVMAEFIDELGKIGNPESLVGPYEEWKDRPDVIAQLAQIYGPEPNPLSELIFRKSYEEWKAQEEV